MGSLHGDMAADSNGKVYIATSGNIQVIGANGVYGRDLKTTDGKIFQGVHGMKIRKINGEEALIAAMPSKKSICSKIRWHGSLANCRSSRCRRNVWSYQRIQSY